MNFKVKMSQTNDAFKYLKPINIIHEDPDNQFYVMIIKG